MSDSKPARGYAARVAEIEPFRVVEVLTRATELSAQGRDIVHTAGLADGATHYSQAAGIPQLRQALSDYYRSDYGLDIGPERIMVTPGASGALLLIAALLMNPGDEMLMTDPGYPCNRHFMRLVEGRGQLVPVDATSRFQLSGDLVSQHWRESTIGRQAPAA